MITIKSVFVTAEKPLKGQIRVNPYLYLIQFENYENVIAIDHLFVVCVQHPFPSYVEIGYKYYNWKEKKIKKWLKSVHVMI